MDDAEAAHQQRQIRFVLGSTCWSPSTPARRRDDEDRPARRRLGLGFGGCSGLAHLLAGYIAYSGDCLLLLLVDAAVGLAATVIAGVLGVASGDGAREGPLPRSRCAGEALGSLPIILPPTVIGFYLLEPLFTGVLNRSLSDAHGRVPTHSTTATGCVIAASVAAYPFCMRAARAAIEGVQIRGSNRPRAQWGCRTGGLPSRGRSCSRAAALPPV